MKITVIGTGYVGLVTGACLAEMGNHVVCLDLDAAKIRTLEAGGIPIYEPGLHEMVARNRGAGRLQFTTDVPAAVAHGTLQFIGVGTPPGDDGSADLQHVLAAARNIGRHMTDYKVVIDKSTVPVGTAARVKAAIADALATRGIELEFAVVSNPEFLKEGAALDDFMRPDRIVIGADDERAVLMMRALYSPFTRNHDRLLVMDLESAEFTKYAANSMLATRISFMNELALLAEQVGVDIELVRKGIGSDPRIGYQFLYAGAGYGGSCFPKDVKALISAAAGAGIELKVLAAVEAANDRQKHVLVDKVVARFGDDLAGIQFAVWGLAFKPGTDDMREAPSRVVIEGLSRRGARIKAFDPVATDAARDSLKHIDAIEFVVSQEAALEGSDALLILTEWKQFKSPDFDGIKSSLKHPVIFDGRNLYEPRLMQALGIEYHGIGRGLATLFFNESELRMILVTGGAGFIGANFVLDWLAATGEAVLNLDALTYAGNRESLKSLDGDARHVFVQGDICDRPLVDRLLAEHRPRAVVHFAAESHVDRSIHGPGEFMKTNIDGTFTLLEATRAHWSTLDDAGQAAFRFHHVSTDEVYGSLGKTDPPFAETHPYEPNSPYSASKAASDHLVRAWHHTYGLPVVTTNCSNNYGPYHFPEKLIPLMIVNALAGKPLPVYGDGQQVRDWLYVKDHCAAIREVLARGRVGETYNVGGWNEKPNIEIVQTVCALLDELRPDPAGRHDRHIRYVTDRPGHDRRYAIDARKLERELGWKPAETFETGIRKTVRWYLDNPDWVARVQSGAYRDWVATNYAERTDA